MSQQVIFILHDQLPAAMFGEQLAPFSILGSLVLIGSTLLLARRHAMWILLVFVTLLVTIRLSAQPRYYMMILPTLMLGWLVLFCRLAQRAPRVWGELILVAGLSIVTLNNVSASVHLFREQRLPNFLKQYRNGEYIPAVELSEVVRQYVKPNQKVLAPWGSVMSVLSGRHVYTQREIFPRNGGIDSPKVLAGIGLDFVFTPGSAYRRKEPLIERLMAKRVIRPIKVVAAGPGEFSLMTLIINVPAGDWRQIQRPPRAATAPAGPKRPPKRARPPKSVIRAQAQAAATQRSP
jgi:signal transduction histidine kinase